jgi:hypothetical protein
MASRNERTHEKARVEPKSAERQPSDGHESVSPAVLLLRVAGAARLLGVTEKSLRHRIARNQIPRGEGMMSYTVPRRLTRSMHPPEEAS